MKWYNAVAILCLMATIAFFIDIWRLTGPYGC